VIALGRIRNHLVVEAGKANVAFLGRRLRSRRLIRINVTAAHCRTAFLELRAVLIWCSEAGLSGLMVAVRSYHAPTGRCAGGDRSLRHLPKGQGVGLEKSNCPARLQAPLV